MTVINNHAFRPVLHPVHGVLLAGTFILFLSGLLSDLAYASSYQIQWTNFASWLHAGGLLCGSFVLLWSIVNLIRISHRSKLHVAYTVLLLATWLLGFFNSLIHAKDVWAIMPTAIILSVIVVLLSCVSIWLGFSRFGIGGEK
ncbi:MULTISPECIES: DUF2231 domain-containing protein [unclassified Arsukibacterium]|uniref:DUF2231 domain-containing protein n=1 Tax=unclassified Arsukibacterium TaxID=2635278 RepID=UPI000C45216D|nr:MULTISPECIES: DUF2231 domain-containing protein [unclassified Arsukibacterium]MAA96183.1 hypothetical protein [Rheinheimera sp.]MBM32942.1 hypothetical protein [Rheinheimera sp.]HAW92891.1 hypothetical protein [Candidatus Azambacteria bacterium]